MMNKEQYLELENYDTLISLKDLQDQTDRTLLYAYDYDRNTVIISLEQGEIKIETSFHDGGYDIVYGKDLRENKDYTRNLKRIYPEKSDFEFCKVLQSRGVPLYFTPFSER